MKEIKVRLTLREEMLGTCSNNKDIHREFIASKSPDASTIEDEVAAVGAEEVAQKAMTVYPRFEDGSPFIYDYLIRGFFKEACSNLRKVDKSESSKIKAFKKEIDGLVFVEPRKIPINLNGEIGNRQRPLRAQTAQGERISLAESETVPAGSTLEFTVVCLKDDHGKAVLEWLDYGRRKGLGQWRNSGCGSFDYKVIG